MAPYLVIFCIIEITLPRENESLKEGVITEVTGRLVVLLVCVKKLVEQFISAVFDGLQ